jgi:hypothetical protein
LPYAQLVERVWSRLERHGTVFMLGGGVLAGRCPACDSGTVSVQTLGSDREPRLRLRPCSAGCSEDEIAKALQ